MIGLIDEIDRALAVVSDLRVAAHIRSQLVDPNLVMRGWDYGEPNQQFPCWTVLEDDRSGTGIAYCAEGFGPARAWGLVFLGHPNDPLTSMGMDSGWYATFMEAYFESFAPTVLPIWHVMRGRRGARVMVTDEMAWDDAWELVDKMRAAEPAAHFYVDHAASL